VQQCFFIKTGGAAHHYSALLIIKKQGHQNTKIARMKRVQGDLGDKERNKENITRNDQEKC
jgi:hypothetical protein